MRNLLVFVAVLLSGCATLGPPVLVVDSVPVPLPIGDDEFAVLPVSAPRPEPMPGRGAAAPDTRGILNLIGRWSVAHACPVSPLLALTAAHVAERDEASGHKGLVPYHFSNGYGESGYLSDGAAAIGEDLGTLTPGAPLVYYYKIAAMPPGAGDKLWLLAYDWRKTKSAFADRVIEAETLRIQADHIIYRGAGPLGSSGSCVLNAAGEVVGINVAGVVLEDHGAVGIAVGVWPLRGVLQ
jgi:hypothetical protein